jgi:L-aspartate oxidase
VTGGRGDLDADLDTDRDADFDSIARSDAVIVGSGVAGLSAALGAARRQVTLLTKVPFGGGGSSSWAQGGIAAALGDDDAPALHAADTLAAGAGLSDPEIVELLTEEGPQRVRRLLELGTRFDRDRRGHLALGREAAHSRRRILHAHGDATGAEIVRALAAAVRRSPAVEVVDRAFAEDLALDEGGTVAGVVARHADGRRVLHAAPAVVLATGGSGRLYLHTTNPPESTADGLGLAARAGVLLKDLEFVQFHPTALAAAGGDAPGNPPMPLLTEALRGEGAVLVDERGRRFMPEEHPDAELAPRDVVARAIWRRLVAGSRVFLDAREAVGERFPERFPTVFRLCQESGLDPRREPIPVAPAAHYHMGGIAVDANGRASLPGLWACGEVAATGAHGANRLASNSLLEALVFGARVAEDLAPAAPRLRRLTSPRVPRSAAGSSAASAAILAAVPALMWEKVGVVRDGRGLAAAVDGLEELAAEHHPQAAGEARNLLAAARMVAAAALARRESRGGHYRADHPAPDPAWRRHLLVTLAADGAVEVAAGALESGAAGAVEAGALVR